jgi:hypothetical protein
MSAAHDIHVVIDELTLPSRADTEGFAAAVSAQLTRLLRTADRSPELDVALDSRCVSVESADPSPGDVAAVLAHMVLGGDA